MDRFDYVMYGKIFKYKDNQTSGQLRVGGWRSGWVDVECREEGGY